MIPILYDKTETEFTSNGLGRLRDCLSCVVTEERNGIYECDFEYPITGAHYDEIQAGRIIGATHDESGDIQPFDIVSYTRPVDGIVKFHCTHVSYRLSYVTAVTYNINSLAEAFGIFEAIMPEGYPFSFWTDKTSTGYLGCSTDIPSSIKSKLGGMQGSILDSYGGEYEWDKWTVKLFSVRGQVRNFAIRYGVNMLDYNEELSIEGTFSRCFPYWTDGGTLVYTIGVVDSNGSTVTGRKECVPLDLSDKFESVPTEADLRQAALTYMDNNNTFVPVQNIHVEFARLQDLGYEEYENLLECNLCDAITVIFPDYNGSAQYKIVKTVWDVLRDRYESMELGDLSVTLAEALGVSSEQQAKNNILNSIYPIGSVYISTSAVSPADLFGGTWQRIQGRFLLGADSTYSAGSIGGEETHTLTVDEIPAHAGHLPVNSGSHTGYGDAGGLYLSQGTMATYGTDPRGWDDNGSEMTPTGVDRGGDQAHNNMPPYLAVYMWERTA